MGIVPQCQLILGKCVNLLIIRMVMGAGKGRDNQILGVPIGC